MQNNQISGRVIAGAILIGLGTIFLISSLLPGFSFWSLWPFFIIVPGGLMLLPALRGDRQTAGLAVPGTIITGTGVILLYQNITGHWGSWLYVWTLYPAFLGFGLWLTGRNNNDPEAKRTGKKFMTGGIGAFILLALLFGLCSGGFSWWPLLLIGLGAWLLLRAMNVNLPTPAQIDFSAFSAPPPAPNQEKNNKPALNAPRPSMPDFIPEPPTPPIKRAPAPPPKRARAEDAEGIDDVNEDNDTPSGA